MSDRIEQPWRRYQRRRPPDSVGQLSQLLGQPAEFGRRGNAQLRHELRAMQLDGAFRDLQLFGDLFVELAGDDTLEDGQFAGRERSKARAQPLRFSTGRALEPRRARARAGARRTGPRAR